MTVALLILAGAWIGPTIGYILAGILLMGRDVVAHVDLPSAAWVEVSVSQDRRRLWVNTERGLVCRICGIDTLVLPDDQPEG